MTSLNALEQLFRSPSYPVPFTEDGGTITVDRQFGAVRLALASSGTCTLAAPDKAGIFVGLIMAEDNGDVVLTVTDGYDQAGTTTMTFDTAGDWCVFYSIDVGGSFYWRVLQREFFSAAAGSDQPISFADVAGPLILTPAGYTSNTIRTGTYASTASNGTVLSSSNTYNAAFLADDGGANIGASSRNLLARMLLTVDQSGGSIRSSMGQLKLLDGVDVETGIYTAVQGYVEMAGTHISKSGATFSCIDASMEITTKLTVNSGGEAFGIHVETTGAGTITNNGTCAAIGITKADGAASWPVGLLVNTSAATTGIEVGTATTGISLSGTMTTGISVSGTMGNAINATGTFSDHVIDIQPGATLGDYKAVYIGTWGSEAEFNDGGGLFRMYGKVGSGGTASANIFVRTVTESTSGPISAQFYTDSDAGTPGPTTMSGVDAFAILNAGKYLAASVGATDGMHAMWAKVGADVTSVCNGNVCSLWVDNQMNCAVGGWETGIFLTTGGSVPDSVFRLNTSSSGWANLLYFDDTMVGVAPLSSSKVDASKDSAGTLLMNINGTTYYIPYYDSGDLV